jgi:SAM-dependent methyltransferase
MDREHWNKVSKKYDGLKWVHDWDLLKWCAVNTMKLCPVHGRVLEIGCGTGALTKAMPVHAPEGVRFVASDISRGMLDHAREHASDPRVEFKLQGDPMAWHTLGGAYDVVVARMVLHNLPYESEYIIRSWLELLKPGGWLVVIEGPPPVAGTHVSTDLYRAAMALKEPGRKTFHAHNVSQWMIDVGCEEVQVQETFSHGNSLENWLAATDLDERLKAALRDLHWATHRAHKAYQAHTTDDEDMLMRWRHCIVAGRKQ